MRWLRERVCLLVVIVCAASVCLAADATTPTPPSAAAPSQPTGCVSKAKSDTADSDSNSNASTSDVVASTASDSGATADSAACAADTVVLAIPSPGDRKAAQRAFREGVKMERSSKLDEAFYEFEQAAKLDPRVPEYLAAREITRQNLAAGHIDRGNVEMQRGQRAEALTEFTTALNLDPQNAFAQQRIRDAAGGLALNTAEQAKLLERQDVLTVNPLVALRDFHYRGDARGLLTMIATSFGLTVLFDDTFPTAKQVRFDLSEANFSTAMDAASVVTKTFSVPLESTVLYAAADTPDNHKSYDRMGMDGAGVILAPK